MAAEDHHTFVNYLEDDPLPGFLVPQSVYSAPNAYTRLPNIPFYVNGQLGVNLQEALDGTLHGLTSSHDAPVLSQTGAKKATLRIRWIGYDEWSHEFPTHDHTAARNPLPIAVLVSRVATEIELFLKEMRTNTSTETKADWHIGKFSLDQIFLVELRHVSRGSWQPVLAVDP